MTIHTESSLNACEQQQLLQQHRQHQIEIVPAAVSHQWKQQDHLSDHSFPVGSMGWYLDQ